MIDQGIEGYYNKIHLFDDYLNGESQYKESTFYTAGTRVRVVCAPWGTIGLSICFDLRYPCLYNKLVRKGANIIVVPSAFTYVTGHAHWVTLIKARAIETQSFIIAPAQCGTHDDGRKTYGHSLIVSPWGEILNNAQEEEGCFSHIIDLKEVSDCRSKIKMSHSCQTIGKNYEKDIGI